MIPLMLWHSQNQAAGDVARTHEELDRVLDRASAAARPDWPVLAEVTQLDNERGALIYVGFHVDRGTLMYAGPDHPGRNFSRGSEPQRNEVLLYMMGTSDCEIPASGEVAASLARAAAHEFADTGLRPTCVEWQTWDGPGEPRESDVPEL